MFKKIVLTYILIQYIAMGFACCEISDVNSPDLKENYRFVYKYVPYQQKVHDTCNSKLTQDEYIIKMIYENDNFRRSEYHTILLTSHGNILEGNYNSDGDQTIINGIMHTEHIQVHKIVLTNELFSDKIIKTLFKIQFKSNDIRGLKNELISYLSIINSVE